MIVLKISLDKSFVYLSKNSVFNYSLILTQKDATREFRTRTELVSVQIYILARKPLPADPGGGSANLDLMSLLQTKKTWCNLAGQGAVFLSMGGLINLSVLFLVWPFN